MCCNAAGHLFVSGSPRPRGGGPGFLTSDNKLMFYLWSVADNVEIRSIQMSTCYSHPTSCDAVGIRGSHPCLLCGR